MAFVGVGVFFVSLPDSLTTPSSQAQYESSVSVLGISGKQLVQSFKSTAMLIFIQAIPWFSLRQYRALIEDHKSFYRYYMRRANYLISFKAASSEKKLVEQFVKTLLIEELSGRLKKGETTEVLEGQRVIDQNFAESVLSKTTEVAQRAIGKKGRQQE